MKEFECLAWFSQLERAANNRFSVLEEVQNLLGFGEVEWRGLLSAVQKVEEGFLVFSVGDLKIYLYLEPKKDKAVQLSVELKRENMEKCISYKYSIGEIEMLSKEKQLKIESFEDEINGEI